MTATNAGLKKQFSTSRALYEIKKILPTEFRNRLDGMALIPLSATIQNIVDKFIAALQVQLDAKEFPLSELNSAQCISHTKV